MAKLILQSKESYEGRRLKLLLEENFHSVFISFGRTSTYNSIIHDSPELFIYVCNTVNNLTVEYLKDLYSRGYDRPTILLVDRMLISSDKILEFKNVHILEKALMFTMLNDFCDKILKNPNAKPQSFRRYSTNQPLEVESVIDGRGLKSNMKNLSLGGACCVFDEDPQFSEGDLVRLKVSLDDLDKFHHMHAKVVWNRAEGGTGRTGLGLKFISEKDMYKQLINRL